MRIMYILAVALAATPALAANDADNGARIGLSPEHRYSGPNRTPSESDGSWWDNFVEGFEVRPAGQDIGEWVHDLYSGKALSEWSANDRRKRDQQVHRYLQHPEHYRQWQGRTGRNLLEEAAEEFEREEKAKSRRDRNRKNAKNSHTKRDTSGGGDKRGNKKGKSKGGRNKRK